MSIAPSRIRHLPPPLRNSTRLYYVAAAAYAFSVALPHAILTPILLSKGLSFSDITLIQIGYSAAVFLFEVPSGVLSDISSRKRVYLASKALIAVFFILVLFAQGSGLLFLAWAIYGLSAALDSGTIGNDVILNVRDHLASTPSARAPFVDYLVRIDSRIDGLFMLSGGAVGAVLYGVIGPKLYWVSTIGSIVCFFLILFFFPERKSGGSTSSVQTIRQKFTATIANGVSQIKDRKDVRTPICILMLTQIFLQTHFQLWQAFFLVVGFKSDKLGFFYIAFQLISFTVSFLSLRKIRGSVSAAKLRIAATGIVVVCIAGLTMTTAFHIAWATVIFYCLFVSAFWLVLNDLNGRLRNNLDEASLSTMTSFSSMTARLASIVVLGLLTLALQEFSVSIVVPAMFLVAVLAIALTTRVRKVAE